MGKFVIEGRDLERVDVGYITVNLGAAPHTITVKDGIKFLLIDQCWFPKPEGHEEHWRFSPDGETAILAMYDLCVATSSPD